MELMKKIGSCLFLFILCFGLVSCAYAGDVGIDKNMGKEKNSVSEYRTLTIDLDDDDDDEIDDDDSGDEGDAGDNYCELCGGECDNCDICLSYEPKWKEFEWKGFYYSIYLEQFNLTDEELTDLFTQRDDLREKIDNLRLLIEKMELSRSDDILLAIDELFDAINKITENTEFNGLLLSLKDINITELNSTFDDLRKLLESIKEEYPDEDFTEIDLLMSNLETLINEELEAYENLTKNLNDTIVELYLLYEKYPFLGQDIFSKYGYNNETMAYTDGMPKYNAAGHGNNHKVLAGMKETGLPYFSLVLLILLSLIGLGIRRKF